MASFFNPVHLVMGEGTFAELGTHAATYGTHALIIVGRAAMERSGRLAQARELLAAAAWSLPFLPGCGLILPPSGSARRGRWRGSGGAT